MANVEIMPSYEAFSVTERRTFLHKYPEISDQSIDVVKDIVQIRNRALRQERIIPAGIPYILSVAADIPIEEQWFVFDTYYDPEPSVNATHEDRVDNAIRRETYERLGYSFAPIAPRPLVEPDWRRIPSMDRSITYAASSLRDGIYLVREVIPQGKSNLLIETVMTAPNEKTLIKDLTTTEVKIINAVGKVLRPLFPGHRQVAA